MRNARLTITTSSLALALGALFAVPAHAQDAAAQATTPVTDAPTTVQTPDCPDENQDGTCDPASTLNNADTSAQTDGEIVVTGSRIRRDEYSTVEPITVITAQEITQSGFNSATDALQSGAVTQGASQITNAYGGFVTDGGTGANTLGLRGLGPARTLILLNGRRLAPGGSRGSVLAADLNVLPTAIVERIEVLKAGASSIYGSDAIAGVVNIITDRKLTGLTIDAQANVPEIGAGVDKRVAASFGIQIPRLSLVGSVEYRKRDALARNQSEFFRCPIGGFLAGEGTALGSDDFIDPATGQPKCFTLDNGGVTINTLGLPTRQAIGRTSGALGNFNRFVPAPGQTTGPFPGFLGVGTYDRDTFDPQQEFEPLITGTEILTGYLSGTYDFGYLGNSEIYGEVLATRRKSSSPLYRQLSLDYLRGSPLLPENIRDGVFANPTETSSGQQIAARAFIGYGLTDSSQQVDYVRASGGLRGDFFFSGWRYDAYAGKSWNDATYDIESFLTDRLANSLNVVQNADGSFSCASQASNRDCVAAPALSAAVIGGNLPQAFRDYIVDNTIGTTEFRETTLAFGVDGPLFQMPGGSVQLALGAEYRKQRINDQPDANSVRGNLFGLTAGTPTVGSDSVREVFGELFVPIVRDLPFLYRLNVNGSLRYTDYKSYGGDTTYKIAGEWEPVRGLGFRGSYGTSYRAPALAEQFLGATSGFLGSDSDPCSALPAAGEQSPTEQIIARNCASVGLPADFEQRSGITVFRVGGAEAGLEAETSTNWSVGVVARPPIPASIGSLSLALDYFDIKVENGVSDLAGGTILNRCYAAENFDPTAGFCRFVNRDSNNILQVTSSFVNLSESIVKGFEFNGRFATKLIGPGTLTLNANVTKYTEQSSRLFPEEFLADANGIITQPDWVGNFDAIYATPRVTFRYGLDWVGGDKERTYNYFAFDNLTGTTDPELVQAYRDFAFLEVKDYFLHNASVQFNVADRYEFTVGVRNLFNKAPPRITNFGLTTVGNSPIYSGYDLVGRSFFANVNFKL
ncbi:outer membrane receptor protein involved in Fe transport [Sphingomonas kaistensis]|uniref:Outer membrane receptor protein involved in Fe transport n=1 Tax=Sphingomonas kaistensis TaxID=298708 RepID=A0A7X5Y742_9SPHN|nr:TonB-dependent receptor [Sphingomonas kaistensis]NJC06387.1 outer membrane receptor protein involved in Fe transport [Sphingomonas kaistensis]